MWHSAFDSSGSGSGNISGSSDDPSDHGYFGVEADEFAFLRDEEALPSNETKWKDALIFLIDCSAFMQFPADEDDMREMEEEGRISVKPEGGSSLDSGSGHSSSARDSSAAAASSSSSHYAVAGSSAGDGHSAGRRDRHLPQRSQFQMVLSVVLHSIRNKIICTPDDYVGVVFFGAQESQNANNFPHIYVHTPLQNLTAAAIRKLDRLMDEEEFNDLIGSMSEKDAETKIEMDKILWVCSSLFSDASVANAHKRIIILSNNDTPFNPLDPMSRMRAIQKGKDLRDLDIGIELLAVGKKPIGSNAPKPFNVVNFYKDILIVPEDEAQGDIRKISRTKFMDLKDALFKKCMKKRSLGSVPLQLGGGVNIGIKLYCMFRETRKESAVLLDKETNEKLEAQTRYLDTNTGAVLKEYEMKKYYPYGGTKVVFTDDEMKSLKEIADPGLVLMGFKPYDALKPSMNFRSSYFIYPDDEQFTESSKAFKALLFGMAELKQMAICRLIYRKGSIPRFVALMPQLPKIDPEDGEVLTPPGMNLIFLPYADDLRKLRFDPTPIAPPSLISSAKKVVAKLSVRHLPQIQNPVLQKHYRVIQAIALDEEPPKEEDIEDNLLPDEEGMSKYRRLIQEFASEARALGEAAQAEIEPPSLSRKRKTEASGDGDGDSKRAKKEEPDYEEIDWKQQLENDTLKKLTVPVLKVYCRHHKLPLSGSKADLLERVTTSLTMG